MTLTWMLLVLTGIICTETKIVHVDINLRGCSDSDGEHMYALDGEEMGHADFTKGKFVMTMPEFADPYTYEDSVYEFAVAEQKLCKQNMQIFTEAYKSPAEAEAPPMSSIYPRHEVKVGTDNTLICLITGFYPPRLTVRWTRNNKNVTQGVSSSQLRVNVNDFSYNQFFTLKFTPQEGDIYTCTVEHQALEGPMTREFDVEVCVCVHLCLPQMLRCQSPVLVPQCSVEWV
ncbi:H-2 class II histocompatibility antigen, A-K alpha chain-like isoform X2 [Clupea harengus]|uniref:H-2 class II histocompatibility antigen, A-K alpha chain-like isoform X2 n=1 Tax=Clupea harengus TaxID=7950 RepID=A0A8M1KJT6_CLUHA|nr:H-2 class II histocompatibility antigen, A-K alpha chain-like isoform X2 [Clupea harengus]